MDVREKLVELQMQADIADNVSENKTQHREFTADFMMANGVTVQEWISVKDRLPEEHDSIWARLYGTEQWQPGLFRKCSYDVIACVEKKDGSRRTVSIRTYDGKWDHNKLNEETVVCWQPMPQPPIG